MEKIYSVQSRHKVLNSGIEILFQWWVSDRKNPIVPYEEGIASYARLPRLERRAAEYAINENFKRWEAEALKDFLNRTFGFRLRTEITEVILPNDFS